MLIVVASCGDTSENPGTTNASVIVAGTGGSATVAGSGGSSASTHEQMPVASQPPAPAPSAQLGTGGGPAGNSMDAGASTLPGSMGADATVSAAGECGTRAGMRGKTTRTLMLGGASRTYVAYLPPQADPTTPLPFVYAFHGANQSGAAMFDITEYSTLADSEGIAVVYPDGQDISSTSGAESWTPWTVSDDGAPVCGLGLFVNNPNDIDFAFMDAIKADLKQDQCLDEKHVFATGFSMGGYFTHRIACDRADVRAAAPHSGGTVADLSACSGRMPIIIFHGVADSLIGDNCDDPTVAGQDGFPASALLWAQHNGCQTTYTTTPTNGPTGNGQCYLYDGCPAGAQVELCTFTDMDHAWAGSTVCSSCIGLGEGYASATQLQWSFFKQYAW
jgi:polyhydroxybutyrate depolymerase